MTYDNYFIVQWTITTFCQQRCKHCYISSDCFNQKGLNKESCYAIIDKLVDYAKKKQKILYLMITGGDPLLRSDIYDILAYIVNHHIMYIIMGNPYEINESVARKLKKLNIVEYQLSLDGIEAIHDNIREKNCFYSTTRAIHYLSEAMIPVSLMVTVSRSNQKYVDDIITLADQLKVHTIAFGRLVPIGNAKTYEKESLTANEHKDVLKHILKNKLLLMKRKSRLNIIFKEDMLWSLLADEMNLISADTSSYFERQKCSVFKDFFAIDFNGDVFPCRRLPISIGNILKDDIVKILSSDIRARLIDLKNHPRCAKCNICSYCSGCIAQKYDYSTGELKNDIHCWK